MESIELFVQRLNRVRWGKKTITPEAEALIQEFLHKVRPAIQHVCSTRGVSPAEAHGITITAGYGSPEYKYAIELLFKRGQFVGACARGSMILTIAAAYCWDLDPELSAFPNPWLPVLKLYEAGYSTSGEDDPKGEWVQLWVGHRDGIAKYQIVPVARGIGGRVQE
jgi:hypothetical protein